MKIMSPLCHDFLLMFLEVFQNYIKFETIAECLGSIFVHDGSEWGFGLLGF